MANIVVCVQSCSRQADDFICGVDFIFDNGITGSGQLVFPFSELLNGPTQINNTIKATAEAYALSEFGITVGGGERINLVGGVV